MVRFSCDVCGRGLPADYKRPKTKNERKLYSLCNLDDVCGDCLKAGELVDVAGLLLKEWRAKIEHQTTDEPPEIMEEEPGLLRAHDALPRFLGKAWMEKQTILRRMLDYRKSHGLGCWAEVCKLAGKGTTPELLRAMCLGEVSPAIDVWRAIGEAMDKLEPSAGAAEKDE